MRLFALSISLAHQRVLHFAVPENETSTHQQCKQSPSLSIWLISKRLAEEKSNKSVNLGQKFKQIENWNFPSLRSPLSARFVVFAGTSAAAAASLLTFCGAWNVCFMWNELFPSQRNRILSSAENRYAMNFNLFQSPWALRCACWWANYFLLCHFTPRSSVPMENKCCVW